MAALLRSFFASRTKDDAATLGTSLETDWEVLECDSPPRADVLQDGLRPDWQEAAWRTAHSIIAEGRALFPVPSYRDIVLQTASNDSTSCPPNRENATWQRVQTRSRTATRRQARPELARDEEPLEQTFFSHDDEWERRRRAVARNRAHSKRATARRQARRHRRESTACEQD